MPVPGQEVGDPLGRMIRQPGEDIGEPSLRVDVVELGGFDERVDRGGASAAFVGAGEGPVVAADGDAAQRPLGGVVGDAQATIIEEARERGPALETVVDRLGGLVLCGELCALRCAARSSTRRSMVDRAHGAQQGARRARRR